MNAKRDKRISMFCNMVANLVPVDTAKELAGLAKPQFPKKEMQTLHMTTKITKTFVFPSYDKLFPGNNICLPSHGQPPFNSLLSI